MAQAAQDWDGTAKQRPARCAGTQVPSWVFRVVCRSQEAGHRKQLPEQQIPMAVNLTTRPAHTRTQSGFRRCGYRQLQHGTLHEIVAIVAWSWFSSGQYGFGRGLSRYAVAILIAAGASAARLLLKPIFGLSLPYITLFPAIMF